MNADINETTYIRWNVTTGDEGGSMHFHCIWRALTEEAFLDEI